MNDLDELRYPTWQVPLQEVILEFDQARLTEKALLAEAAILQRLRELRQSNNGHAEHAAISDGLSLLKSIRRDRLGYPDWEKY